MTKRTEKHVDYDVAERCLVLLAIAAPLSFATWMALLNNFTVDNAGFTGREIGILQSVREIPGFLAFTAVFFLVMIREQIFALVSLFVLGVGTFVTGMFPTEYGLYATTLLMSIGFHYFETIQMSLSLQWLPKDRAPKALGKQLSCRSIGALIAYGSLYLLLELLNVDFVWLYMLGGGATIAVAAYIWYAFPRIEGHAPQHKHMVLRKRYWLFYALTFLGGARRQIFVVFAGFLMVTKFGFDAAQVTGLYLLNHLITMWFAPKLGGWIAKFGERRALIIEYIGLIFVFSGYAVTDSVWVAAALYIIDHLFFSFAIAQKSYLQKIADARDIAATSSVSFSINHFAAVVIPVTFGTYLWSVSPSYVFWAGAAMACGSLLLSFNIPRHPTEGNEVLIGRVLKRV